MGGRGGNGGGGAAGGAGPGVGSGSSSNSAVAGDGDGKRDGLESTLGRIGERTVDVVAKLRRSDRFKNQMVSVVNRINREVYE